MKKIGLLIGTYIVASLIGSAAGMFLWLDPSSMENHFISLLQLGLCHFLFFAVGMMSLGIFGILGCCLYGLIFIGGVIVYWKTEIKWILLMLSLLIFLSSMYSIKFLDIMSHWV